MSETPPQEAVPDPQPARASQSSNGHDRTARKRLRRSFTDAEKAAIVAKHKKSGLGIALSGKSLGIRDSVLRRWVNEFGATKPAKKAKKAAPVKTTKAHKSAPYDDGFKQRTVKRWADGTDVKTLAKELKVHVDTIRGWWRKWGKGKTPRYWDQKKAAGEPVHRGGKKGTKKRKFDLATRKAAVARLVSEPRIDVQKDIGISSGMMTTWIRAVKKAEKQERKLAKHAAPRDIVAVPVAEVGVSMPHPGSKSEGVIYLRETKVHLKERVMAGRMDIDDPILLYSMSALNSLLGHPRK